MVKIRSLTEWTTATGKRRRIRLYEAFRNMKGRCRGGKSKDRGKYWNVACDFDSWIGFRTWALDKGYRLGMELDREDSLKPYDRDNCRWIIRKDHLAKTLKAHKPNCPCPFCKPKPSVTWVDPECGF